MADLEAGTVESGAETEVMAETGEETEVGSRKEEENEKTQIDITEKILKKQIQVY